MGETMVICFNDADQYAVTDQYGNEVAAYRPDLNKHDRLVVESQRASPRTIEFEKPPEATSRAIRPNGSSDRSLEGATAGEEILHGVGRPQRWRPARPGSAPSRRRSATSRSRSNAGLPDPLIEAEPFPICGRSRTALSASVRHRAAASTCRGKTQLREGRRAAASREHGPGSLRDAPTGAPRCGRSPPLDRRCG